jgi:predicted transcriptional regulator of viral defense system
MQNNTNGIMTDGNLETFFKHIRAQGRYTFTFDELKENFDLSDKALRQSMFRLQKKNEIAVIRQGFYVIVPPEYASTGTLPETIYIDSLMKFLDKNYYVGLLSAAALHGAAHQQPTTFYVVCRQYKILSKTTFVPVPLSPVKTRRGTIDGKWKIIINMQIEPDL